MSNPKKSIALETFIVILIAFFCYGSSLQGHFVFDDYEAVVNNEDVKLNNDVLELLKHDFWGSNISSISSHKSYRPLTVLSFRMNNYFSGSLNSTHMKITNFFIYTIVCILILIMFKIISKTEDRIPLISASLFACHPIHSEAVSSIVGRAELLSALFYCLAFIFYKQCEDSTKTMHHICYSICSCLCASISLFSKENGITIIAVCIFYDLVTNSKEIMSCKMGLKYKYMRNRLIRFMILISIMIFLLYWRMSIMDFKPPIFQKMDNHMAFNESIFIKSLSQAYLYALNMWLLICPNWLCCDWSFECVPLVTITDLRILAIPLPWFIIGIITFYGSRLMVIGLIYMIIPFLPACGIITVGFVIAERVLFLPSIGFCLILGTCIQKCSKIYYKTTALCFTILIAFWITRSAFRAAEWSNSTSLFESAAIICPNNAKIHYNRALTASVNNNLHFAELMYMEALRLYPEYEQALNNLANLLRDAGRIEEAEAYLWKAVQIRPSFGAAWMNLGVVLSHTGRFYEAEKCYTKSLQLRPKHVDSHYNLGNLYLNNGRFAEAKISWLRATKLDPAHVKSWTNLLTLLDSQGKIDEVLNAANVALRELLHEPALHFALANSLGKAGLYDMAEKHFKTAIHLKKDELYYANLGVLYHRWNKTGKAEMMYKEALKLNPKLKSARDNYQKLLNDIRQRYS